MILEWLKEGPVDGPNTLDAIAIRLGVAFTAGLVVAATYRVTRRRTESSAPLAITLVLLTMLIALITVAIGNSVARAFSLVGVLSIVRFRAAMDDIRDTAYVVFSVAAGMTVGTGLLGVTLVAVPIVAVAALILSIWERSVVPINAPGTLRLKVALGTSPERISEEVFPRYLRQHRLVSAETAKQGTAMEMTYRIWWISTPNVSQFASELTKTEGVQGVELRGE